jgi:hypothetical protein
MTERSILFSAAMVPALLAGTKTQTRRALKPQPETSHDGEPYWFLGGYRVWAYRPTAAAPLRSGMNPLACPYGQPGGQMWGRETFYAWGHWAKRVNPKKRREQWHFIDETIGAGKAYRYDADEKLPRRKRELHEVGWWKRPAIFMPRAASRIALDVTDVRVERLHEISEEDAIKEGTPGGHGAIPGYGYSATPLEHYRWLWESINGPDSWDANPWVWGISFWRIAP